MKYVVFEGTYTPLKKCINCMSDYELHDYLGHSECPRCYEIRLKRVQLAKIKTACGIIGFLGLIFLFPTLITILYYNHKKKIIEKQISTMSAEHPYKYGVQYLGANETSFKYLYENDEYAEEIAELCEGSFTTDTSKLSIKIVREPKAKKKGPHEIVNERIQQCIQLGNKDALVALKRYKKELQLEFQEYRDDYRKVSAYQSSLTAAGGRNKFARMNRASINAKNAHNVNLYHELIRMVDRAILEIS